MIRHTFAESCTTCIVFMSFSKTNKSYPLLTISYYNVNPTLNRSMCYSTSSKRFSLYTYLWLKKKKKHQRNTKLFLCLAQNPTLTTISRNAALSYWSIVVDRSNNNEIKIFTSFTVEKKKNPKHLIRTIKYVRLWISVINKCLSL